MLEFLETSVRGRDLLFEPGHFLGIVELAFGPGKLQLQLLELLMLDIELLFLLLVERHEISVEQEDTRTKTSGGRKHPFYHTVGCFSSIPGDVASP